MDLSEMFSGIPRREPSSDIKQMASVLHQLYTALQDEGFTVEQSLRIVCTTVRSWSTVPAADPPDGGTDTGG